MNNTPENFSLILGEKRKDVGPNGGDLNGLMREERCSPFNADALENGEMGLHRFEETKKWGVQNEKPWHRLAAALLAEGKSNTQVAELAGCSPQTISLLKANRWFQELVAQLTNAIVGPSLSRFAAESDRALDKIAELIDCDNPRIALAAATYVTDQTFGKPVQKVISISASTVYSSEKDEYDAIQKDLEALKKAKEQIAPPAVSTEGEENQTTT